MGNERQAASGGIKSEINITPLVDVVLVLLIIFMVVIPMTADGLRRQHAAEGGARRRAAADLRPGDRAHRRDGRHLHQQGSGDRGGVPGRFREVIRNRENKIVFFAADGELLYDRVATFMDLCRDNGAKNIGIVFDDIKATPGTLGRLGAHAGAEPRRRRRSKHAGWKIPRRRRGARKGRGEFSFTLACRSPVVFRPPLPISYAVKGSGLPA